MKRLALSLTTKLSEDILMRNFLLVFGFVVFFSGCSDSVSVEKIEAENARRELALEKKRQLNLQERAMTELEQTQKKTKTPVHHLGTLFETVFGKMATSKPKEVANNAKSRKEAADPRNELRDRIRRMEIEMAFVLKRIDTEAKIEMDKLLTQLYFLDKTRPRNFTAADVERRRDVAAQIEFKKAEFAKERALKEIELKAEIEQIRNQ